MTLKGVKSQKAPRDRVPMPALGAAVRCGAVTEQSRAVRCGASGCSPVQVVECAVSGDGPVARRLPLSRAGLGLPYVVPKMGRQRAGVGKSTTSSVLMGNEVMGGGQSCAVQSEVGLQVKGPDIGKDVSRDPSPVGWSEGGSNQRTRPLSHGSVD